MRRLNKSLLATVLASAIALSGCSGKETSNVSKLDGYKYEQELNVIDDNNRTYYEIFVYSFYDSDGDGIGDLKGVTEKLDYIQDLGFNGIWLMPIMPSPTYHKYDTTNYCDIDSQYGTMDDFKNLVEECHKRDINIIIDFMMNHTSVEHQWFKEATKYLKGLKKDKEPSAKDCVYFDYYNFVKEEEVKGNTYYQVGATDWYYEGAFWDGMPDLKLSSKNVRKELENAAQYWLDLGVDGFRLDGVKYFCAAKEDSIEVLTWFNDYVKAKKEDAYLVGEVWTDITEASEYLKSGIDSVFDFSMGNSDGIIAGVIRRCESTEMGKQFANSMITVQDEIKKNNSDSTVAEFLTNHDTGRTTNFFGKQEKVKLAYALELFSTGNTFVYYGEEIGLNGPTGKDENYRAPMYWSESDKTGMCDGPENMDEFDYYFPSLAEQKDDKTSIYNFVKRCIRIRNENPENATGEIAVIPEVKDDSICAITKTYNDSKIEMLYNLSAETKTVTLSKDTYGYEGIRGYVSVDGTEVTLEGDTVTLPAFSVVILK